MIISTWQTFLIWKLAFYFKRLQVFYASTTLTYMHIYTQSHPHPTVTPTHTYTQSHPHLHSVTPTHIHTQSHPPMPTDTYTQSHPPMPTDTYNQSQPPIPTLSHTYPHLHLYTHPHTYSHSHQPTLSHTHLHTQSHPPTPTPTQSHPLSHTHPYNTQSYHIRCDVRGYRGSSRLAAAVNVLPSPCSLLLHTTARKATPSSNRQSTTQYMYVVYMCCTCAVQLVYTWCTRGVHVVHMWCTCTGGVQCVLTPKMAMTPLCKTTQSTCT